MTEATLLYLLKNDKILLFEKQRKIGAGKLNGVGGKMDKCDKTITDTMIRESQEEMGVTPLSYKKVADIVFHNPDESDNREKKMHVHVFISDKWQGEPTATDEMKKPKWCDIYNLPFDKMLPDDKHWLPKVMTGELVKAEFKFDKDWNIVEMSIKEVKEFNKN